MPATTSAHLILRHNGNGMNGPGGEIPSELWELMERHRGDLVNQGYAILGNLEDAEETAQETFCEAFQQREKLAQVESVGAWLRSINKANALNRLRSRKRRVRKESRRSIELPGRSHTTGGFGALEIRDAVSRAIEQLPDELRDAVVLHYWEHLSYDQIAARLRISPRSVRRHVREAYLRLHQDLRGFLGGAAPERTTS